MDQRVLEFIESQKRVIAEKNQKEEERIKALKEKEKEEVLFELGLYEKDYFDPQGPLPYMEFPYFDREKGGKRYRPIYFQISDEDYQEVLKYRPEKPEKAEEEVVSTPAESEKNTPEDLLNTVAIIILIVGIIALVVSLFVADSGYHYNWWVVLVGGAYFFSALMIYAIMKVLRSISLKLDKLK